MLSGKNRITDLIRDLQEYNNALIRLCSWEARSQLSRGVATTALQGVDNIVELHLTADAAEEAANGDADSVSADGKRKLAEIARFRARANPTSTISERWKSTANWLTGNDYKLHNEEALWTLARSADNCTVVFVEWKSYLNNDGIFSQKAEKQIFTLADFLSVSERPADLRTLRCLGLFHDQRNSRYGLVYRIPDYLSRLSQPVLREQMLIRKPSTLTGLLDDTHGILDLGVRFALSESLYVVLSSCTLVAGYIKAFVRTIYSSFQPAHLLTAPVTRKILADRTSWATAFPGQMI